MNDTRGKILLKVTNIVKNYVSGAETLHILKGINFEIEEGKSVAISGQSGSGKSTLLNIIGGLDHTDEGNVFLDGTDITSLSEKEISVYRSKQTGFVFQFHYLLKDFTALENIMLPAYIAGLKKKDAVDRSKQTGFVFQFHYLLKDFTALENIMLPAYIAGLKKKDAVDRAKQLLADVKLEDRSGHFPSQLSGGERQRVAVARSMVNDPALILADEPTGNLDPQNSDIVAELLYENAQKRNKTLIIVTHDRKVAQRASIRFVLENGVLSEEPS